MLEIIKKLVREEKAQGMVEYILIVALIAVIAVAAVKMFGGEISKWFKGSAEKLQEELDHLE
jgi:Flp pilus assembly pilin Flp